MSLLAEAIHVLSWLELVMFALLLFYGHPLLIPKRWWLVGDLLLQPIDKEIINNYIGGITIFIEWQ